MARDMTGRMACCVPFCGRTFKAEATDGGWIMCGKHWRLADASLRRRRTRLMRRYNRAMDRKTLERLYRLIMALDERGKRQVIERAGGI